MNCGYAKTMGEFWDKCIEPVLPKEETVIKWNDLLLRYVNDDNVTFAIRGGNTAPKDRYCDLRRGFLNNTNSGYKFFYTDNFFAAFFCKMAIDGYVPNYDEFVKTLNSRRFPSRFGSITKEEIELMAIKQGDDPGINSAGYKIAHIFPVGMDYCYNGTRLRINSILNKYFPRGEREDWIKKKNDKESFYVRNIDVPKEGKKYLIAHFLRFVNPLNYFLFPKKDNESNLICKEIAENDEFLDYAKFCMYSKYKEVYSKYISLIMTNEREFNDSHKNIEIDIKWENHWKRTHS